MDGLEFELRLGQDIPHPSRPAARLKLPPAKWELGFFSWVSWLGRGVDHPAPFSAEVKERVGLYI